jgi:hypothetical protein
LAVGRGKKKLAVGSWQEEEKLAVGRGKKKLAVGSLPFSGRKETRSAVRDYLADSDD